MAKKTILKLVQDIAEAIQSDDISELDETTESVEILHLLESTCIDIASRRDWEFMVDTPLPLDDRIVGDTQINRLVIPDGVVKIQYLQFYNSVTSKMEDITYLTAVEFIQETNRRTVDSSVDEIDNDYGVSLRIYNDRPPRYWTSFDELHVVFDAYEGSLAAGNRAEDSLAVVVMLPVTDFTDPAATLSFPERMETLILNEAISTASVQLRQIPHARAERMARRAYIRLLALEPVTVRDEGLRGNKHGKRRLR